MKNLTKPNIEIPRQCSDERNQCLQAISPSAHEHLMRLGLQMHAADSAYATGDRPANNSLCVQTSPIFTPDECEQLVRQIGAGVSRPGLVTSSTNPRIGVVDPARYVAFESFFDPRESQYACLARRLAPHIDEAARRFNLPVLRLAEAARLVQYEERGHFNWHPDGSANVGRRLTLSLQLSASIAYSGGDLLVLGESGDWGCADRAQGAACLFPSKLFYRVVPIDRGRREAIVLWFY